MIDLAPVPDANDKNDDFLVFDLADHSVIADTILPEFSKALALEGLPEASGIFKRCNAFMQEPENAPRHLTIKFIQFLICCRIELNLPAHNAS